MLRVRFESIYTETDRFGNMRRMEHRFEAEGSASEVCMVLDHLTDRVQLPGTRPIGELSEFGLNSIEGHSKSYLPWRDD